MATIQLYADKINRMQGLIKETKQTVTVYRAELLTLKTKMLTINKSVCDLGDITASIQASSQIQEEKITSLNTFHKDCEDFISEVVRIDHDVADRIHTRKEEFYAQYYYLKPEYEKTWLEVIKDWFTAVREWCRQKWELQAEERAVRCVRMHKEAVVFLTVGVLGQKQVKEGEMPRYLKEFLKQLRTNPDRIIMNAEQIKKYEELKRWPDWWGKEGGSDIVEGTGNLVTVSQLKEFGWRDTSDAFVKKLNDTLIKYGIKDKNSVALFMATMAAESDYGRVALEEGSDSYFAEKSYGKNRRGAGYIQITHKETHLAFLKTMNDSFSGEDTASYIAKNYAMEASAWYWSKMQKTGEGNLNAYVTKNGGSLGVFLITQYYVNGVPNGINNDLASIRKGDSFTINENSLSVNGHTYRLPNGWNKREDARNKAMEVFK